MFYLDLSHLWAVLRKSVKRICMNAAARVAKIPGAKLEKAGTSIETGTTSAPGVCPTLRALAFRRSADEKKQRKKFDLHDLRRRNLSLSAILESSWNASKLFLTDYFKISRIELLILLRRKLKCKCDGRFSRLIFEICKITIK